jgi:hypothetical protein
MVKSIRKSAYNYPLYNMYILILSKLKLAGQGLSDEIDQEGLNGTSIGSSRALGCGRLSPEMSLPF